jgi:O-antigen ligase
MPYLFEYGFIFYFFAVITGFIILKINDADAWIRLTKFNWIINFYLFAWGLSKYEITLNKLLKFFAWAYLIPNIYALASAFAGYDPIHSKSYNSFRLLGVLESATYHAHTNGLILIFFLVILYFQFTKLTVKYKWLLTIATIVMTASVFLTLTRGIWLSLALSILAFLFVQNRKLFTFTFLAGLATSFTLYFCSSSFNSRVHQSLATKVGDQERWALFDVHVKLVVESPIVGIGYSSPLSHTPPELFAKYGYKTYIDSHAHNQLLNVLAMTGVLGLIPFLLFNLWFLIINIDLVKKFRAEKNHDYNVLATACLITQVEFFVANLTDIGFEYAKIRSLILIVWALVFCMWRNKLNLASEQISQNVQ